MGTDLVIILVGFMGCGKTTVGRELARRTGAPALDADAVVEAREGRTIAQMFEKDGEPYFRELERRVLAELCKEGGPGILCTGGGAVLDERNVETMRAAGTIVWLRATPESIARRIADDRSRPLLKGGATPASIAARLEPRLPLYERAADFTVDTDGKGIGELCDEIEKALARQGGGRR